jgi:hypothetical protein
MSAPTPATPPVTHRLQAELRSELLRLAHDEDEIAAREAEHVRYWEAVPVTVVVHRRCAAALRAAADELLTLHGARHDIE